MLSSFQDLVVSQSTIMKQQGPKVEQLETDVNVIRDDLNQLSNIVSTGGSSVVIVNYCFRGWSDV